MTSIFDLGNFVAEPAQDFIALDGAKNESLSVMALCIYGEALIHALRSEVLIHARGVDDCILSPKEDSGPGWIIDVWYLVTIENIRRPVEVPLKQIGNALSYRSVKSNDTQGSGWSLQVRWQ
jgi:hypothetical protein